MRDYAAIDNDKTARLDDESIDSDTPPDTNVVDNVDNRSRQCPKRRPSVVCETFPSIVLKTILSAME